MTPDEAFEKWWEDHDIPGGVKNVARSSYLAATQVTAQRCVEICNEHDITRFDYAQILKIAIRREFGL